MSCVDQPDAADCKSLLGAAGTDDENGLRCRGAEGDVKEMVVPQWGSVGGELRPTASERELC